MSKRTAESLDDTPVAKKNKVDESDLPSSVEKQDQPTSDDTEGTVPKCPCSKEECLKEWSLWAGPETDESCYHLQHCEVEDCHNIYWEGKNGWHCNGCGIEGCEPCTDHWIHSPHGDEYDDELYCKRCQETENYMSPTFVDFIVAEIRKKRGEKQ